MFWALSAHLQEDTIVYMQHMVLSLYKSSWWPVGTQLFTDRPPWTLVECDSTICCMYTTVSSWRWAIKARIFCNQCIKLVINIQSIHDAQTNIKLLKMCSLVKSMHGRYNNDKVTELIDFKTVKWLSDISTIWYEL